MKLTLKNLLFSFTSSFLAFGFLCSPVLVHGQTLIIEANSADRVLLSTNGETGTSLGNAASIIAQVGETATDNNQSRYYLPFGLLTVEQSAAILNAPNQPNAITLNLFLGAKTNVEGFNVDVYAFPNRADGTLAGQTVYYNWTGPTLLHAAAVTPDTPDNTWITLDITDHAKSIVGANDDNRILAYRFQTDPSTLPNADGIPNRYIFQSVENINSTPYIEVIPEPSAYALFLGLGLLGFIWIWRRLRS